MVCTYTGSYTYQPNTINKCLMDIICDAIIKYIALWRVYSSFDGKNAVLFTVLSVLFNFLEPVFLFVIRNNQPNFAPLGIYNPDNYEQ